MKNSIYNNFVNYDNKVILYNGFSGNFMIIEPVLLRLYESLINENKIEKLREIHSNFYNVLVDREFLVDKNIDEVKRCLDKLYQVDNNYDKYHLIVNPTMNCNFKCWYCYEVHVKNSKININTKDNIIEYAKNVIQNSPNLKYFLLGWFGGEPLLQFKDVVVPIMKEIHYICENNNVNFSSNITTNGLLIKDEVIEISNKYNLNDFQITLDGYRETHNKVRYISQKEGSYDKIVNNIKKLLRNKIEVTIRINCSKETFSDLDKIAEDFEDIRNNTVKYLTFNFHRVWQEEEQVNNMMFTYMHFFRKKGFKVSSFVRNIKNTCYADKRNHATINYNGDVYKCTAREFNKKNREGILTNEGSILWDDRYKKRFDKKYTNISCFECSIFPVCKGGCSQHSLENEEDYCVYGYDNSKKNNSIVELLLSRIEKC